MGKKHTLIFIEILKGVVLVLHLVENIHSGLWSFASRTEFWTCNKLSSVGNRLKQLYSNKLYGTEIMVSKKANWS